MKYVQDGVFAGYQQKPWEVAEDDDSTPAQQTNGQVLTFLAGLYVPDQGMVLDMADLRRLNKALQALEDGPDEAGWLQLEDEDFGTLKRAVLATAPKVKLPTFLRHAPYVADLLEGAVSKNPAAAGGGPAPAHPRTNGHKRGSTLPAGAGVIQE